MSSTTQNNDELKARSKKFVTRLYHLESSDDSKSRAALAALRFGLREKNGVAVEMMPHVVEYLGDKEDKYRDSWYFAVGALFAMHPQSCGSGSLGTAFGRLRSESESIEKRFQLLLSCEEEDLFRQLIQVVSLLESRSVAVNWFSLLSDLTVTGWSHPNRHLQLKWARDFYRANTSLGSDASDSDTTSA